MEQTCSCLTLRTMRFVVAVNASTTGTNKKRGSGRSPVAFPGSSYLVTVEIAWI